MTIRVVESVTCRGLPSNYRGGRGAEYVQELDEATAENELRVALADAQVGCFPLIREQAKARAETLQAALDEFHHGPEAAARRELSKQHPDHGGEGGPAFRKALDQLRKNRRKTHANVL